MFCAVRASANRHHARNVTYYGTSSDKQDMDKRAVMQMR